MMDTIKVYTQEDLDKITDDFTGHIHIYGGNYFAPIVLKKTYENSSVVARGNSSVVAWGNSSVVAWENSSVVAWENSSVVARGNSSVVAWENSSVEAWENSSVEAWENSSAYLNGYAQVRICSEGVRYKASGNSRVILPFENIDDYINYFGIKDHGNFIVMYKAVHKVGDIYKSDYRCDFVYEIGKIATEYIDDNVYAECGVGLHVSTLDWALRFGENFGSLAIIECEVPKDKTVVYKFSDGKIRTSELKVIREVPLEECGVYGKILAKKRALK